MTVGLQAVATRLQPRLIKWAGKVEANPIAAAIKQAFSELNLALLALSVVLMLRTANGWWWHGAAFQSLTTAVASFILAWLSLVFVVLFAQAVFSNRPDCGPLTAVNAAAFAVLGPDLTGNPFLLAVVVTGLTAAVWAGLTYLQGKLAKVDAQLAAMRHLLAVLVVAAYLLLLAWLAAQVSMTWLSWLTLDHPVWVFLLVFCEMTLWYIGINGYGVIAPVVFLFAYRNLAADLHAIATDATPTAILTPNFWDYFLSCSGAGLVGALVILCLVNPNPDLKKLGKSSLSASLFSVSEPMLYGLPITMNPYLLVPFLFGTPLLGVAQWFVFKLGWVALPAYHVADLPLPFSVLFSTLDWRSLLLALATIAIATAMYAPGLIRWSKERPADPTDDDFDDLDLDF